MVNAFQKAIPTFSKGIPALKMDVIDPMNFDAPVKMDLVGLSFLFKNGRLKGVKDIVIKTVKWDTSKNSMYLEYRAPLYLLSGNYFADGRILILPITGDGEMNLKLKNMDVNVTLHFDEYKKNDKTHISIKKYNYDFKIQDYARYNLTNLFNGQKQLSEAALKFMNENWEIVTKEFGRPLMNAVADKIFKNVNKFMSYASMEELALSYP